ncbi:MAG: T9SS C-terminal target domain-containing protein, partial [Calditrichaeota bacterium]
RKDSEECDDCSNHSKSIGQTEHPGNFPNPILLKHTIRVGRNCTGTNCTTVEIYSLQTYCKFVLPAEWIACWGDLPNGMNSLRAGSVAVRTYASWFVYHPLSNNYDICDNTFCQMFGDNQYSNTNLAVDQTERMVMINASEEIVRSEYSAENNNSGCGDGWSGTGDTWPCIYDPVCLGQPNFGHGRGMCQWGSIRWANGTKVLPSSPCSEGINHGFGTKSWDEILAHYYPDYSLIEAYSAHILSAIPDPSVVSPGETFQIHYTIGAGPAMSLMLGASIAPAGTGNWIDDPAHDVKVSVNEGTSTVSRWFEIPPSASPGLYDMLVALWYDVDGNDLINSGDFVFHLISVPEALTVTPTDIQAEEHPPITSYSLQQNFPNPFNPATTIEFSLPQKAMVQLKIFDTNGKEIQTLLQKVLPSGVYQTQWSAEGVPSGTYFYRLKVYPQSKEQPIFIQTRKMTLIR